MKKVSRSILPEQHKKPNKNEIKKASKVLNGLDTDLLDAIPLILEKWYECESLTEDKRNEQLVHFIMDKFQVALKPYIDNFSKTIDIKTIVQEALQNDDVQQKLYEQISKILITAVRKLQIKSQESGSSTTSSQTSKITDKELDNIFKELQSSKKPNLSKYRKSLTELDKKHTNEIIEEYRKSCKNFYDKLNTPKQKTSDIKNTSSVQEGDLENIQKKQTNILRKKFKPYDILKKQKNYFSFFNELFKKLKDRITKIFGPLFKIIKKICSVIGKTIRIVFKLTIIPLVKGIIGIGKFVFNEIKAIGKGFIKTLKFFKLDKLIKSVYSSFVDIGKLVGNALKNTFAAFIKTPAGMYAIGFLIGYLWVKIKKILIGQKLEDGILKNGILKIKNLVMDFVSPFYNKLKDLFFGIINKYVVPIVNFFKPIIDLTGNITKGVLNWITDNPTLVSIILGICPVIESILSVMMPARTVFKAAGNPIAGLIAAGVLGVYFAIKNMFAYRKDLEFHLAKGKQEIFTKFTGANSVQIQGMNFDEQKNYEDLTGKIGTEQVDLEQLIADIDQLKDEYESDKSTTLNLAEVYPEFVESVFNSGLFGEDKTSFKNFKKFAKGKRVVEQLRELITYVNKRYDKLITIQAALSSTKSSKELKNMLSKIADFDNGKITISENVNRIANTVDKDDFSNDKSWFNTFNPHKAEEIARFNADILAGKKIEYSMTTSIGGVFSGSGTTKIDEDQYRQHLRVKQFGDVRGMSTWVYEKKEINPQKSSDKEIDKLTEGLKGKDREIVKNYLLSHENPDFIKKIKESGQNDRLRIISDILSKWKEHIEENEKRKNEQNDKLTQDEITKLYEETLKYKELNKKLQIMIDELTKGMANV